MQYKVTKVGRNMLYLDTSTFYKLFNKKNVIKPTNAFDDLADICHAFREDWLSKNDRHYYPTTKKMKRETLPESHVLNAMRDYCNLQNDTMKDQNQKILNFDINTNWATSEYVKLITEDMFRNSTTPVKLFDGTKHCMGTETSPFGIDVDDRHFISELKYYFTHEMFNRETMQSYKYDLIFMSIMSTILQCSNNALSHLELVIPNFSLFREQLVLYLQNVENTVYNIKGTKTLYLPGTFSVFNAYFNRLKNPFQYTKAKYFDFTSKVDIGNITKALEFMMDSIVNKGGNFNVNAFQKKFKNLIDVSGKKHRYPYNRCFTGTACVGKTTILNYLKEELGYSTYSRGELGTFGGKATDAAALGSLSFAYQYIEKFENVVLDRNSYDNFIWRFIMDIVNPEVPYSDWIPLFMKFIRLYISETQFHKLQNDKMAIIIDCFSHLNRLRMLNRGEDGDLNRARVSRYVDAQNFGYFASALIFGWFLIFTSYGEDAKLKSLAKELVTGYFVYPENTQSMIDLTDTQYFVPKDKKFDINYSFDDLNIKLKQEGAPVSVIRHNFADPSIYNYAKEKGIFK